MTLEDATEMVLLERHIAQLERALTNPNLAAASPGSPENQAAFERIARNRMRLSQLKEGTKGA